MAAPLDPDLLRRAAGVRRLLVLSVVLGVLSGIATVAQAFLIGSLLAAVIIDGLALEPLLAQVIWLGVVIVLRAALAWAAEELARRSALATTTALRREVLQHAAELGPRWRSGTHGGGLVALVTTGIDALHDYLARYVPQLALAAIIPVGMIGVLFRLDPLSGLIAVLTVPLIPLFMALVGWYTQRATRKKWRLLARLAGHFSDVVAGLPTLKVFGRASQQADAVRRVTDDYRRATMATLRIAFLSSLVLELLATLSVAIIAVTVGLRMVGGGLTLQVGLTVLILAPEVYLQLRTLGTQFHAAADGQAAVGQVLEVLNTPLPKRGDRTDVAAVPGARLREMVVGDRSDENARGVVGPVELVVPAGKWTVLLGPSGVGKSTVLHVLAGVQQIDGGTVTVDGVATEDGTVPPVPLAEVCAQAWRRRIAWCGQHPVLTAGTIRENLTAVGTLGGGILDGELWEALDVVAARSLVEVLPDGLDTVLGQDGAGLSQGQRQRLCLARTVLAARTAGLVLLDEPTSALDEATEAIVLQGLSRALAGRTVVVVTHREAPVSFADQVVTLRGVIDAPLDRAVDHVRFATTGVNPW